MTNDEHDQWISERPGTEDRRLLEGARRAAPASVGAPALMGLGTMFRSRRTLAIFLAALAITLVGCGGADDGGAPVRFTGASGPALYAEACASCHGTELQGTDLGPPSLDALYRPGHHADAAFLLAARRGARSHHWDFGDMPRVEGLSDEQLTAIVAYVRERQRAEGIE